MAAFTVPKDYGYVVLAAGVLGFQLMTTGFEYVGKARSKVFNEAWRERAAKAGLLEEHKKATGDDRLPRGGYPDMGDGRFAALLSYGEWYEFACAQRAHYNYVEAFGPVVSFLLTGGLAFPRTAAALGLVYAYGRRNYARSYAGAGPDKRYGGQLAPWSLIGLLGLFGVCLASGAQISGLTDAVKGFVTQRLSA